MTKWLLSLLLTCVAPPLMARDLSPTEFLDERTGATVIVTAEPWVFALERSIFAANARDYVSLTAVEVDRSGRLQMYLIGYVWSTIDSRSRIERADPAVQPLELLADGRLITLKAESRFPDDLLDDRRLKAPASAHLRRAAYLVSRDILQYLATCRQATVDFRTGTESDADPEDVERELYDSWSDGRAALSAFLRHISP